MRGYFLKCDIRKFFDNIDHGILKQKLRKVISDEDVLKLLFMIIDSYETFPGKGIPLGNQTSQWFAVYYLDSFDRLIKEKMRIRHYTRYMDDCVLIHPSREYLKECLEKMEKDINSELAIEFNGKTQIVPLKNGVNYLGWHFYLTESGKVIRKVKQQTKYKYRRKLKYMAEYASVKGIMSKDEIRQVINSYQAHLSHGHTYRLQQYLEEQYSGLFQENDPAL